MHAVYNAQRRAGLLYNKRTIVQQKTTKRGSAPGNSTEIITNKHS